MSDHHPAASESAHTQEHAVHVGNTGGGNPVWQRIKSSKALKLGLPLLIVALLPVVVLLAREQQTNQSRASKATVLSLTPVSTPQQPIRVTRGEDVTLDIMIEPGTNLVSVVRLDIRYDPDHLELIDPANLKIDPNVLPQELTKPHLVKNGNNNQMLEQDTSENNSQNKGKGKGGGKTKNKQGGVREGIVRAAYSIGADPAKAIKSPTKIGTITFKAKKPTNGKQETRVRFLEETRILSLAAADQANENVLSNTNAAYINVNRRNNEGSLRGKYVRSVLSNQNSGKGKGNNRTNTKGKSGLVTVNVPGAMVTLTSLAGSDEQWTSSSQPEWEIADLEPGRYRLEVKEVPGYRFLLADCGISNCNNVGAAYSTTLTREITIQPNRKSEVSIQVESGVNPSQFPTPFNGGTPVPSTVTAVPACSPTSADVTKDGKVDAADLNMLLGCYNKNLVSDPACAPADVDKNGRVNPADYNCVIRNYTQASPSPTQ